LTTIRDIAKLAGVAPSTVSHVLNGTAPVSKKTKEKVDKVITATNFRPNSIAKSLKQKKTYTIGILTDNISGPFVPPIIDGIEQYLYENNYSTLIVKVREEQKWDYKELFKFKQVDGIIFASSWVREIEWEKPTIPYTYVYGYSQDHTGDYIIPDDYKGAYDATMHLIHLHHNKIGFINGPIDWYASLERLKGFMAAHHDVGLTIYPKWIKTGDWGGDSGYKVAEQLLTGREKPTAIFAGNDVMASGVMLYCWKHGIRIPEDLSIIGFDNQPISSLLIPKLTTIELPTYEMGKLAAQNLLKKLRGEGHLVDRKKVECKLINRESTAKFG